MRNATKDSDRIVSLGRDVKAVFPYCEAGILAELFVLQ
jgi:hypothetical protein